MDPSWLTNAHSRRVGTDLQAIQFREKFALGKPHHENVANCYFYFNGWYGIRAKFAGDHGQGARLYNKLSRKWIRPGTAIGRLFQAS